MIRSAFSKQLKHNCGFLCRCCAQSKSASSPKWYTRQGFQHTTWMCLFARMIGLDALFPFLYFKFKFLSFVKITVTEKVLSCFLFQNKETKDYVTSPRAWTCDLLDLLLIFYVISLHPKENGRHHSVYDTFHTKV